ncbi:MAG: deoxyribonuclease [Parcubacteria group bacterium]|nr:deoxyribonuclease [Parcubacteria group bacterium]
MSISAQEWDVTPKEAVVLQKELREQVKLVPLTGLPKTIGGCDVSMNRFATSGYAGFITLSYPRLEEIAHSVVKEKISFPYIPGLLSFREIPMLLRAWEKLEKKPDVLIVDGIGIAHPRRLGIATHLGLILRIPTIGCAKSVLIGVYEEPGAEPGSISYLRDPKAHNEIVGAALRTKKNVKPVFISPGHLITLSESIEIAKRCVLTHRLPEPTRLAHNTVNAYRVADQ